MPTVIVHIFVAIRIPLPRALGPFDVYGMGLHMSGVMDYTTRKNIARLNMARFRSSSLILKFSHDLRIGQKCRAHRLPPLVLLESCRLPYLGARANIAIDLS